MTHRKDFFEDFTDNVDGVVYFADQSKIKPSGLGTIRLKLPGLPDFLLDHVLYLPQLKRNLLSLVHIPERNSADRVEPLAARRTRSASGAVRGMISSPNTKVTRTSTMPILNSIQPAIRVDIEEARMMVNSEVEANCAIV